MRNFINSKLLRIRSKINWFDEQLKQPVKDDGFIPDIPYQIVSQWFLDIVLYGFIITFIWNAWFGWQGWNNIMLFFANGLVIWMLGELIKNIRKALKE